jgi:hypothetical protein
MNRTRSRILFVELVAWLGLASLVSCVSSDDVPGPGRVEHPDPSSKSPPPPATLSPPPAPAPVPSEPSGHPPPPSDVDKQPSGFTRSPLDKAIAEDDPARPWSKNVPKHQCTNDGECGDGFCNRGRCAAIWTYTLTLGQRCGWDVQCGSLLCIDGRCRSCVSDTECERVDVQDGECIPDSYVPGSRECNGVEGSGGGV